MGPSTKAREEESRWKGKGGKEKDVVVVGSGVEGGGGDESASLSFVVQMLLATVVAREAHDWWAGLNCKVHFRLMAAAARL